MNHASFPPFLTLALTAVLLAGSSACAKHGPAGAEPGATTTASAEPFGHLTVDELVARQAEAKAGHLALYVFDNNHEERFHKGHIPGARWVQFDQIKESDLPADRNATLVFYCANEH